MSETLFPILIGAAIACFYFWLRDRFHLIVYKIEQLEYRGATRRTTTATGSECEMDEEDERGSIGFNPKREE